MPHSTIEYSANVADHHDIEGLVGAVHRAALEHGLAAIDALRTRAVARADYEIADGHADNAFVAIHVRVGPGRDDETKQSFLTAVLDAAEAHLGETPLAVMWSIELTEIDPAARINRNHVRTHMAERTP